MSTPAERAKLFKSPWVTDPGLLEQSMREARVNDRYTAELAAITSTPYRSTPTRHESVGGCTHSSLSAAASPGGEHST